MYNQTKSILESLLPSPERDRHPIKNNLVSMCPDSPASYNDKFSEDLCTKVQSGINNHLFDFNVYIPMDIKKPPTPLTKSTREEQMCNSFFHCTGG